MNRKTRRTVGMLAALLMIALPAAARAGVGAGDDEQGWKSEKERAEKAGAVLDEILAAEDNTIPQELLERAKGIAVIPHVVKGAIGIGGRYGRGLVAERNPDGTWGAPLYVTLGGASYGAQLGVNATDLVLVFMEKDGLEQMMKDKLELGASASVAAGPIGRHAEAGVNVTLDSGIYSYSRTKGLFAGVALEGAVLTLDGDANLAAYGSDDAAREVLDGEYVKPAPATKPYLTVLYSRVPVLKRES